MAPGSWLWGQVAHVASLETGYLAAGSLLLLSIALHRRWRLPAGDATDLRPRQLPELKLAFPFGGKARPVMVLIEYRVPLANASGRWRRSGMSVSVTVPGAGTCFRTPPMPSTGTRRRVPIDQVAEPDGLTDPVWGTLDLTE